MPAGVSVDEKDTGATNEDQSERGVSAFRQDIRSGLFDAVIARPSTSSQVSLIGYL